MTRYIAIGVCCLLIILGNPELRGGAQRYVRIYQVNERIATYRDVLEPSLVALAATLRDQATVRIQPIIPIKQTELDLSDDWSMTHGPSITAAQFNEILKEYNSPATGIGGYVTSVAKEKQIDNAYVLFIFIHESGAGTNPNWVGNKGNGNTTHNPGNIRCIDKYPCYQGFADFPSWEVGFEKMIQLLVEYREGGGPLYGGSKAHATIDAAINTWAPPVENDTNHYVDSLKQHVSAWRKLNKSTPVTQSASIHPVTKDMHINAGFNTINCAYWSFQTNCQHFGTDLALEVGEPVYAPVDGVFLTTGFYSAPAMYGYYVMYLTADGYELYLGHLDNVINLEPGSKITAGDVIGYGNELLHTHVQLRDKDRNLVDFMDYYNKRSK